MAYNDRNDRSDRYSDKFNDGPVGEKPNPRQKINIDYKNVEDLRRMVTSNGKIVSRKRAGVSSRDQGRLAQAIKRARFLALLPYAAAIS
jgi:small subunit ribosomal protein S18